MNKYFLLCIVLIISFRSVRSQSVGLVLSGGGAKGLAHIGVIKVLEENNIPIDFIAGTSIGAIVAGLYAAGYTTEEMEKLFKSDEFYFWSTGKIQKKYRYYFMQQEEDPAWIDLKFETKDDKLKVLPPTYLIPENQMDFAFMELLSTTNAACNYDFDSLMVPFFCVAADLFNNQPVVLRKGDLGSALRASMTVPLVFKPITIDGNLLFDGGVLNNFPTDIMKNTFNPDIIIGHKVADESKKAESDDLLQQISNLIMRPTNFKISPKDGILLDSKFRNVGLLDFNKIDFIISEGSNTAGNAIDSIKNLIHRRVPQNEVQIKRMNFNKKKPELFFQNIQIEGLRDPMQIRYIIQSIKHKYNVISLESLKEEYFKLIADEHLKSVLPIARYNNEKGYFDLNLKVEPNKKMEVKVGGNISTKPINQGFASFNYRNYKSRAYTITSNIYFGRFYSSFKLGGRIDYPTTLPFYLSGNSTFNRWDFFTSSSELFFEDVRPPYIIQNEYNHRIETGFPLGLHGKIYGGVTYSNARDEYYLTDIFNKEDQPDKTTFAAFVSQIGIETNSLNYKQFATEGAYRYLTAKYINGQETNIPGSTSQENQKSKTDHSYFLLEAHTTRYFNVTRSFILGAHAETVFSNKDLFKNYRSTLLAAPGFYPTPHSKTLFVDKFHANNYLAGGLTAIFIFSPTLNLRLEGFGFVPVKEVISNQNIPVVSEKFFSSYYLQGASSIVYQTGLGPLSLSVNYYEKTNTRFYFSLNFGYTLFNKRGL